MKEIIFWRVYDREEFFDVAFSDEMSAYEAAKGNGFYGSDAEVLKETIRIFDSVEEWKEQENRDKIAVALAKLTDEEKRLLGLDAAPAEKAAEASFLQHFSQTSCVRQCDREGTSCDTSPKRHVYSNVIEKEGGPFSLYCTSCRRWIPNTANSEMRKEGCFSHSHMCCDGVNETPEDGGIDDAEWQATKGQLGSKK